EAVHGPDISGHASGDVFDRAGWPPQKNLAERKAGRTRRGSACGFGFLNKSQFDTARNRPYKLGVLEKSLKFKIKKTPMASSVGTKAPDFNLKSKQASG